MSSEPLIVSLKKKEEPSASANPPPAPKKTSGRPPRQGIAGKLIVAAVFIALALGAYYFFWKDSGTETTASETNTEEDIETQAAAQAEAKNLVEKVGRHILLPEGEEPTVATVTDPAKLKDQAFFANAKTGYKVLIYTEARKAYLYDPEQDKLIEVAPISTEMQ